LGGIVAADVVDGVDAGRLVDVGGIVPVMRQMREAAEKWPLPMFRRVLGCLVDLFA